MTFATLSHRWFTLLMVSLAFILITADFAEARRGGSFGSRGSRTWMSPAPTQTAPQKAPPIDRSMTQRQTPSQPGMAQTPAAGQRGWFGGLGRGFLGGLLFGGLLGWMFGSGLGARPVCLRIDSAARAYRVACNVPHPGLCGMVAPRVPCRWWVWSITHVLFELGPGRSIGRAAAK